MNDTRSQFDVRFRPLDNEEPNEKKPLGFDEYLRLDLDETEKKALAREVLGRIDEILDERKPRETRIKEFRNQYRQKIAPASWPFPNALHYNVPITPRAVDTYQAETADVFEQTEPKWSLQGPPNEKVDEAVEFQGGVLDAYENLFSVAKTNPRAYFDAGLLGAGWEAQIFKREIIPVIEKRTWNSREEFVEEFPDDWEGKGEILSQLDKNQEVTRIVEYNQEIIRCAVSEHVEWEDAIAPLDTAGLEGMQTVPVSARRIWMRWWDIQHLEKKGDYDAGVAEKLLCQPAKESETTEDLRTYDPDRQKTKREVFVVRYQMTYKDKVVWALLEIDKENCLILRAIRYPYHHHRNYLIPYYIQETEHGLYQPGLADKLQPLNLSANALLAHILNAGLLATSLNVKVRAESDAMKAWHEFEFYPGSALYLLDPNDVEQWKFDMPDLSSMVKVFMLLLSFAEDVTGLTANLAGQPEPEDPKAPGNKTAFLMRKSERKLRQYINVLKKSVNESGYQKLRLIAQFVPPAKIASIMGVDEEQVKQKIGISLPVVTHATAFDVDRLMTDRENQIWVERLMQEPLIAQFPSRRVQLYKHLAETSSGEWKTRLDDLFPDEEELKQMDPQQTPSEGANQLDQAKQRAYEKALAEGMGEEEAQQMAESTVQKIGQLVGQKRQRGGVQ